MIVIAVAGFMAMVAVPGLLNSVRSSRLGAAARQLATDTQEARWRAVRTGWQYRIVGYGSSAGSNKNKYRLLGRSSTAVSWPADTAAVTSSATQVATAWTDFGKLYPQVNLNQGITANGGRFYVSFDARGAAFERQAVAPLVVTGQNNKTRSMNVASIGSVVLQ
jgi:Tfp pilus assembly protein FimT